MIFTLLLQFALFNYITYKLHGYYYSLHNSAIYFETRALLNARGITEVLIGLESTQLFNRPVRYGVVNAIIWTDRSPYSL